tara:strand:+ start:7425 stop:7544 length:120 start_codon:yes stop_codon:yes gene_type:complete
MTSANKKVTIFGVVKVAVDFIGQEWNWGSVKFRGYATKA